MTSAIDVVRSHGGTCRTKDLRARGIHPRRIAAAVASGSIERARIGHYIDPVLAVDAKRAIRVGGRVACASAAVILGLRVLRPAHVLHVEVGEHDSRFRRDFDGKGSVLPTQEHERLAFHWSGAGRPRGALPDIVDVLEQAIDCLPALEAVCMLDAARENVPRADRPPLLSAAEFRHLLDRLSDRGRQTALRSSTLSQAIGESVARERLREAGIIAAPQAALPGGFFADLLIGERLVFECEGYSAHGTSEAFENDRARMAYLRAMGYTVLNFSHKQIVEDWESVLSAVRLAMRRGEHLVHRV
ncbi:DUF559 domain-containing protein [Agromyces sp. NPDC055520]